MLFLNLLQWGRRSSPAERAALARGRPARVLNPALLVRSPRFARAALGRRAGHHVVGNAGGPKRSIPRRLGRAGGARSLQVQAARLRELVGVCCLSAAARSWFFLASRSPSLFALRSSPSPLAGMDPPLLTRMDPPRGGPSSGEASGQRRGMGGAGSPLIRPFTLQSARSRHGARREPTFPLQGMSQVGAP